MIRYRIVADLPGGPYRVQFRRLFWWWTLCEWFPSMDGIYKATRRFDTADEAQRAIDLERRIAVEAHEDRIANRGYPKVVKEL